MTYYDEREAWRREREHRISELLRAGHTHEAIGQLLGCSGPAVTQFIRKSPALRRQQRSDSTTELVRNLRSELQAVAGEIQAMQRQARKAIRDLDEELEAIELDRQLGLR